jgi:hypothetical protein
VLALIAFSLFTFTDTSGGSMLAPASELVTETRIPGGALTTGLTFHLKRASGAARVPKKSECLLGKLDLSKAAGTESPHEAFKGLWAQHFRLLKEAYELSLAITVLPGQEEPDGD